MTKPLVKHRSLKVRHSDPVDPRSHMKNLASEFDSAEDAPAAVDPMEEEAEEELIAADTSTETHHNPQETAAPDFWADMQMMLDDQRNASTRDLRGQMQAQEVRLGARIDVEKHERVADKDTPTRSWRKPPSDCRRWR